MKAVAVAIVVGVLRPAVAYAQSTPGNRAAPPAPASVASESKVDEARRHFQLGVEFFREESFDAALAEFQRANELVPNYRIFYNIAQVQAERHDDASALRFFRAYLDGGGREVDPERRVDVETQIREIGLRVGHVVIESTPAGADVIVDGEPVGPSSVVPMAVNAGVRVVLLRKAGYAPVTRSLTVVGGEISRLHVVLAREPYAVSRPEPAAVESVNRTPMWLGVAATTALAATAITSGVVAKQADNELGTLLNQYPADRSRIDSDRSREKTFSILADATGGAALLAAGFTIYCALSAGRFVERATPARAALDVQFAPSGGSVGFTQRF